MPRIFGHDLLAVIAAAVAIYIIGYLIYGLLFSTFWMEQYGYTADSFAGHEWKMFLGPIMPVLTVLGLAALFQAANASGLKSHLRIGVIAWAGFSLSTLLYGFAYGITMTPAALALDAVHLLLGILAASAILVWRK
ncbi:MAG TPA: hypothetical protein DF715_03775 [Oceanicaulis sp.]|jgi:hypothetical protein|uniref:DUF1761 domain-containing protein n=1 Tax=Glycocaulis albus TaxID=1382801 RepID=A0ABQ1XSZ2_9PROT|nr:DUF1761 domain-containing protein [Glycocaulis albus]MBV5257964.1 DUF1761 domain-containing protein [Synechococcus moorigangaii CMS01]GGH02344.1 hypothetical protein GCM10007420_18220 [Glycocaulis albus]HCY54660.1 hypothetical protein [Oceanicaulis sp.]|tara:strand:+ start:231 stop:638 length:408 start_codon:yes stop_codon:yes gene_type:complete